MLYRCFVCLFSTVLFPKEVWCLLGPAALHLPQPPCAGAWALCSLRVLLGASRVLRNRCPDPLNGL